VPRSYQQLTYDERCQISALKARGDSPSQIGRQLSRHRSSIIRELKRNSTEGSYQGPQAEAKSQQRRFRKPTKMTPQLVLIVEEKLKLQWSPEQISGRLKIEAVAHISHETIYKHIWSDKRRGGSLYKHLRHNGKKYNHRGKGASGRGCIPNRVDIAQRPLIVDEKTRVGDWELDTIIGANHDGVIVSMVDRHSKFTCLIKVSNKTASSVRDGIVEKLNPIRGFVHTLTADNGKEFAYHEEVTSILQADFFFATPYHSWERGLNEHTNGLVRQYLPKGVTFSACSPELLNGIETRLNQRPRKVLKFQTPQEVFRLWTNPL
jgi:transposase, IS30 family